jgi:hypothetical protein
LDCRLPFVDQFQHGALRLDPQHLKDQEIKDKIELSYSVGRSKCKIVEIAASNSQLPEQIPKTNKTAKPCLYGRKSPNHSLAASNG